MELPVLVTMSKSVVDLDAGLEVLVMDVPVLVVSEGTSLGTQRNMAGWRISIGLGFGCACESTSRLNENEERSDSSGESQ